MASVSCRWLLFCVTWGREERASGGSLFLLDRWFEVETWLDWDATVTGASIACIESTEKNGRRASQPQTRVCNGVCVYMRSSLSLLHANNTAMFHKILWNMVEFCIRSLDIFLVHSDFS